MLCLDLYLVFSLITLQRNLRVNQHQMESKPGRKVVMYVVNNIKSIYFPPTNICFLLCLIIPGLAFSHPMITLSLK